MIIAGILSFFVGVTQAFLLKKALFCILGGEYMKSVLYYLVKLVLYASTAVILVLWFQTYLLACAIGYVLGLPVAAAAYFVYQTLHRGKNPKGGDENEDIDNC